MASNIPIWLTVLLAIMTGVFALAGQALNAAQTRKAQAQLFQAQRDANYRDRKRERVEEFYSRFLTLFDETHEAVMRYQRFKNGLGTRDHVIAALGEDDNENYRRMMVLFGIYYRDMAEGLGKCLTPMVECAHQLARWKLEEAAVPEGDFDEKWAEAVSAMNNVGDQIADLARGLE